MGTGHRPATAVAVPPTGAASSPATATPSAGAAPTAAPLVSVIVGVYKHAPFVAECLDSIVAGSYPNLELIVIDDASPDDSDAVIRDWLARHPGAPVRHVRHPRNLGVTKSFNEGVRLVRGRYICIIAADDVMMPDGIAVRVAYLAAHPDKLAVFGDCHVIDAGGQPVTTRGLDRGGLSNDFARQAGQRKELLAIDELMPFNIVFHWAVPGPVFLCRAETFDVVGPFDETLTIEDWDIYLRIAATGRLGFVDAFVSKYREHGTNSGARMQDVKRIEAAKVARKNLRRFGPINALRLAAIYAENRRLDFRGSPLGLLYTAASRLLLFASYRAYLIKRARVLRRHGVTAP